MTIEECKRAFFEDKPVSFRRMRLKINCSHISALIYRKGPKGIELYCELMDRNGKCVYIVKHDMVLVGNDEERRIEVENE